MKFLLQFFFKNDLQVRANSTMIKGGANTGNRDTANSYYEYDGRYNLAVNSCELHRSRKVGSDVRHTLTFKI